MFSLFKRLFKSKPKAQYGVSFDDKIKLDEIPVKIPTKAITFCKINPELKLFEVVGMDKKRRIIRMSEVGTDTEFDIDFSIYEYMFVECDPIKTIFKQRKA